MRSFNVALSLILFATSASSLITIPLTKRQHTGSYLKEAAIAARARAASIQSSTGPTTVPATNMVVDYTARIGIGAPPTIYNLIVDTGSSNTFCGLGNPYVRTSTSIPTGEDVRVTYGSARFSGKEYLDQVTLAPNLTIANQSIGNALYFQDWPTDVDGILGVGPTRLTKGTLPSNHTATIPTVMDNLKSQGLINHKVLSVYFTPSTNDNDTNGVLIYGGIDPTLYEGNLTYASVTKKFPASSFWSVDVDSCTYGNYTITAASNPAIIDTGTTLVLLPYNWFDAYRSAIPGAKMNDTTKLLEIPASSISSMKPLNFTIAGRVFTMDVAAQLFPAIYSEDPKKRYGTISTTGGVAGYSYILGLPFIERYYTVFDGDNNRVGFAQTNNTFHHAKSKYSSS